MSSFQGGCNVYGVRVQKNFDPRTETVTIDFTINDLVFKGTATGPLETFLGNCFEFSQNKTVIGCAIPDELGEPKFHFNEQVEMAVTKKIATTFKGCFDYNVLKKWEPEKRSLTRSVSCPYLEGKNTNEREERLK